MKLWATLRLILLPFLGVVLALLGAAWLAVSLLNGINPLAFLTERINEPNQARVYTSPTIVTNIKPLGQLVSIRVELAQADISVGIRGGVLNFCGHSAQHVARGIIEAGVDLTLIDDASVSYDTAKNEYTLMLPAPQITSCNVPYIRQYEKSGGGVPGCTTDWDTVRMLAQTTVMDAFVSDALEGGILGRAEDQAKNAVSNFVKSLTGSNVVVNFAPQEATPKLPDTCKHDAPSGWQFDEKERAWYRP
jgi:hypothetical protein